MNWSSVSLGADSNNTFTKIHFQNPLNGYLGTTDLNLGYLLKTTDGGNTWNKVQSYTSNLYPVDIKFIGSDTGFVINSSNEYKILKTTNAGNTWIENNLGDGHISKVKFINNIDGFALGENGDVFVTSDCGITWTLKPILNDRYIKLKGIDFTLNNWSNYFIVIAGEGGFRVSSNNKGTSWNPEYSSATRYTLKKIKMVNDVIGFSVGGSDYPQDSVGVILKTINSGTSWIKLPFNPKAMINSLSVVNQYVLYIGVAGMDGIYKSTDGGLTFNLKPLPFGNYGKWNHLDFVSENKGYIAQDNISFRTTNGGDYWIPMDAKQDSVSGILVLLQ